MKLTEGGQPVESAEEIAARFGSSVEFGREHQGEHRCVDGRWYRASCLVSDPGCESIARYHLTSATRRSAEGTSGHA